MDVMFCKYCWNILIAIDQLINTLFGGDPDETISSRLGKWTMTGERLTRTYKIIYKIANFSVELFEKDHFKKSIELDEGDRKIIK
jgi:hypothetical protein